MAAAAMQDARGSHPSAPPKCGAMELQSNDGCDLRSSGPMIDKEDGRGDDHGEASTRRNRTVAGGRSRGSRGSVGGGGAFPRASVNFGGDGENEVKTVFIDAAAMKNKVRMALCKPTHNVTDFYKETGWSQQLARSTVFEQVTLSVIAFNAIWIAIDTDLNPAEVIIDADPIFQVAENMFCTFFVFEWAVRFIAFRRKRDGLRDKWFTFDFVLVFTMVLETWVMTIVAIFSAGGANGALGNASILRVARLLRLSRMARMARLLRAMPELMILIKGMVAAMRSVFFTLFLLVIIMYVFAIAFKQITNDTSIGNQKFASVPQSMYTLLLYGTLLDDVGVLCMRLGKEHYVFVALFFVFVLLAALTVMNMLIGVLCEVVSAVAATEREEMLVGFVNRKVRRIVEELDTDGGGRISKDEFCKILENMEAVRALQDVGVDVVGLVDFADVIFDEDDELSFPRFMEVVLQLRGSNTATVKDIVDLRKLVGNQTRDIQKVIRRMEENVALVMDHVMQGGANYISESSSPGIECSMKLEKADKLSVKSAPERLKAAPHPNPGERQDRNSQALDPSGEKLPQVARSTPANFLMGGSDDSLESSEATDQGGGLCAAIPLETEVGPNSNATTNSNAKVLDNLHGSWDPCEPAKPGRLPPHVSPMSTPVKRCVPFESNGGGSACRLRETGGTSNGSNSTEVHCVDVGGWPMADAPRLTSGRRGALQDPYWCPVELRTLQFQMASLGKVLTEGLDKFTKIQDGLTSGEAAARSPNGWCGGTGSSLKSPRRSL